MSSEGRLTLIILIVFLDCWARLSVFVCFVYHDKSALDTCVMNINIREPGWLK